VSPMVKVIVLLPGRVDRGQEEFRRYLDEKRLPRSAGEFRDLGSGPIFVIVSLLAGSWRHDH